MGLLDLAGNEPTFILKFLWYGSTIKTDMDSLNLLVISL